MTTTTASFVGEKCIPGSGPHKDHIVSIVDKVEPEREGGADHYAVTCLTDGAGWTASGPSVEKMLMAHLYYSDDAPLTNVLSQLWGLKRTPTQSRLLNAVRRWRVYDKRHVGDPLPDLPRPMTVGDFRRLLALPTPPGEEHPLHRYIDGIGEASIAELRTRLGESHE